MTTFPDLAFNAAVMTLANKVCPTGYDISEKAPASLDDLNFAIATTRRITVDSRNSDNTIFGCPEHNWAFRAWHDWTHWITQAPFDLDGELAVAHRQCQDLALVFGHGPQTERWQRYIMAEVYGQACYLNRYGEYPTDQVAFDLAYLGETDSETPDWAAFFEGNG